MNNPYKLQYKAEKEDIQKAISAVLESGYYILGPEVSQFEKDFATYCEVDHTIGVANGLDGLQLILRALEIGPGDEVITTSLSAVATTLAIHQVGATPIFVDIDEYYHLDPNLIKAAITPRTKAVLPVHLYGQPVAVAEIAAICKTHNLYLIEDAAQAQGARIEDKPVGAHADATAYSFYPTKNLGAYGDAGAVTTNNDELAERIRMLRNYGQKDRYYHELAGINSRLDELQAAVLSVKLLQLDAKNEKRNQLAALYTQLLSEIPKLILPKQRADTYHVYHQYVVRTKQRDALLKYLQSHDVPALIHYPVPIHKQPCFPEWHAIKLPKTEHAAQEILSLPIHPFYTESDIKFVAKKVEAFFVGQRS